jgi:hypothetical protein
MTKVEALRLALEALELANYKVADYCNGYTIEKVDEAITAIKAALEAKDQPWEKFCDSHCVWTDHHPDCKLAKDEPVAWRDAAIRLGEELSSVGPNGYYDMDAKEWLDWVMEQNPRGEHSLPQRTWVGLTDEEIAEVEGEYIVDYRIPAGSAWNFAKDIEAKLKEKNK